MSNSWENTQQHKLLFGGFRFWPVIPVDVDGIGSSGLRLSCSRLGIKSFGLEFDSSAIVACITFKT